MRGSTLWMPPLGGRAGCMQLSTLSLLDGKIDRRTAITPLQSIQKSSNIFLAGVARDKVGRARAQGHATHLNENLPSHTPPSAHSKTTTALSVSRFFHMISGNLLTSPLAEISDPLLTRLLMNKEWLTRQPSIISNKVAFESAEKKKICRADRPTLSVVGL